MLKAANGLNAVLTAGGHSTERHLENLLFQTPLTTGSITSPCMSLWATGDVSVSSDLREVKVGRGETDKFMVNSARKCSEKHFWGFG